MQQYDKIKQYTSSVCDQIRWKKAHNTISDEIENHIIDQKNVFMAEGMDETASTDKAIEEMGDPVTVGSHLDRVHRPKIEWSMIALSFFAILMGVAVNFFVTSNSANSSEIFYFYRFVFVTVAGIVCMVVAYFIDFSIIGKYSKRILILYVGVMLTLYSLTNEINGAKRWIEIPIIGAVSSTSFLLLFPTVYAGIIYSMRKKGYFGLVMCGVFFVVPALIFLFIPYGISNVFVCTITCLVLLIISICSRWFCVGRLRGMLIVVVPTLVVFCAVMFSVVSKAYRLMRLQAFLNPSSDVYGYGYVMTVVRDIIGNAKFFGQADMPVRYVGDITSRLPAANTNYIITYLIYRIGWWSFAAIMILLLGFVVRGFYLCFKQKSALGSIVSTSVVLTLTIQMLSYISANLGFQLLTQLSLPFISFGGIATIVNLGLIGLMLSVFKTGDLISDNKKLSQDISYGRKRFEFVDGKLIIDLNVK